MSQTQKNISLSTELDKIDSWFNNFIDHLKSDKFLLKENIATAHTKDFYKDLMSDNLESIMRRSGDTSKMYFIEKLTKDYIQEFVKSKVTYKKLAFDIGNSKVLTWVELLNDDEDAEDKLIMAEAKINAKYHDDGFHISTTIVEERDNLEIPSHYHTLSM